MSNDHSNMPGSNTGAGSRAAQQKARKDFDDLSRKTKDDLDAAKNQARQDLDALEHGARDKVDEATTNMRSFAEDQKDLAANQIAGAADAIGRVADELDNGDQQTIARYARDLAQGLSRAGTQIKQRDTDDLVGAAEAFGRNQPVAFLGAAALSGFVASRFALASAHRRASKGVPNTGTARRVNPGSQVEDNREDMP